MMSLEIQTIIIVAGLVFVMGLGITVMINIIRDIMEERRRMVYLLSESKTIEFCCERYEEIEETIANNAKDGWVVKNLNWEPRGIEDQTYEVSLKLVKVNSPRT